MSILSANLAAVEPKFVAPQDSQLEVKLVDITVKLTKNNDPYWLARFSVLGGQVPEDQIKNMDDLFTQVWIPHERQDEKQQESAKRDLLAFCDGLNIEWARDFWWVEPSDMTPKPKVFYHDNLPDEEHSEMIAGMTGLVAVNEELDKGTGQTRNTFKAFLMPTSVPE